MRYLSVALLVWAFCPTRADITTDDSIVDVYYRGEAQFTGSIKLDLRSNIFPDASPASPVYIRLAPDKGTTLNQTLVDLNSSDAALNEPIHLALVLNASEAGYAMAASADALSIVRWVAGESEIWLRVSQATSSWIRQGDALLAPSPQLTVSTTLGLSQNAYLQTPEFLTNLPVYAARNGVNQAISTLICLDFSASTLSADGTESSLLYYNISAHGPTAQTQSGVFAYQDLLDVNFTGNFTIARGKALRHEFAQVGPPQAILPPLSQENRYSTSLTLNLRLNESPDYLQTKLEPGTTLSLVIPEDASWGITNLALSNQNIDYTTLFSEAVPESNGWHKALVELAPVGNLRLALSDLHLQLVLDLTLPSDLLVQDLTLSIQPKLILGSGCNPETLSLEPLTANLASLNPGRMLSHLTRQGNGFHSALSAHNNGSETGPYAIRFYSETGLEVGSQDGELAAGAAATIDLTHIQDAAYARIEADNSISFALAYLADRDDAAPAHVDEARSASRRWRVDQGNGEIFDAIAFVNLGTAATDVKVTQIAADGQIIASLDAASLLPAKNKGLALLSQALTAVPGAYFLIEAAEPLSLFALRGDHDARFIWQNPSIPLD